METFKRMLRTAIPAPILNPILSVYHFVLAFLAALVYGFPSRRLMVIGVTGTKGKSSTIEFLNAIFEAAGRKTALISSIRMKCADVSRQNTVGRSMPGRFFMQQFLDKAISAGCDVAILEMTSEGARQHRHRFIQLDALIFTNLAPEHIESHGSLQAYADAKFELGKQLTRSKKRPRFMVAHVEDSESPRYLTLPVEHPLPFSLSSVRNVETDENGGRFTFDNVAIQIHLPGEFSILNALAAATLARALNIPLTTVAKGLANVQMIPGRAERVEAGQDFLVVVDYAHTPESLRAILAAYGTRKKICILGSAGGGRDIWKRPLMGKIAEEGSDHVILTNDDPYDEEPRSIIEMIERGMTRNIHEVILDRRAAIQKAFQIAQTGDVVLITGKGIDPIYGPKGKKIPWSDAAVAREELGKLRAAA